MNKVATVQSPGLTWQSMIEIEPRLLALQNEIRQRRFSWQRYEKMKSELRQLVGWTAENSALQSSAAYEIAIDAMLDKWEGR